MELRSRVGVVARRRAAGAHNSAAPHVRGEGVVSQTVENLRGAIRLGAAFLIQPALVGSAVALEGDGEAKIGHFAHAVRVEQDVLQLQVAVAHAVCMHVIDRGHELRNACTRLGLRKRARLFDARKQVGGAELEVDGHAVRLPQHEPELLSRAQHRDDVGVGEPVHQRHLLVHLCRLLLVCRNDLGSNGGASAQVTSLEDAAVCSLPEQHVQKLVGGSRSPVVA